MKRVLKRTRKRTLPTFHITDTHILYFACQNTDTDTDTPNFSYHGHGHGHATDICHIYHIYDIGGHLVALLGGTTGWRCCVATWWLLYGATGWHNRVAPLDGATGWRYLVAPQGGHRAVIVWRYKVIS